MNKKNFIFSLSASLLFSLAVALALQCSAPLPAPGQAQLYLDQVTGLAANYDKVRNRNALTWVAPSDSVDFYLISVYTPGNPAPEKQIAPGNVSTFEDVIDIVNGIYRYIVTPYHVWGLDTIGGFSDTLDYRVGSMLSFTINRGDIFTKSNICSLIVIDSTLDSAKKVDSLRFTQKVHHLLVKNTLTDTVNLDDPLNLPTNAKLLQLITAGYIIGGTLPLGGKLAPGAKKKISPDFSLPDGENSDIAGPVSISRSPTQNEMGFRWVLEQGNGSKQVFVEFTFKDGSKDTLNYEIQIAPYRASIGLRNREGLVGTEMTQTHKSEFWNHWNWDEYYLHRPDIKFSLSIDADSSFATDFDYWLIMPNRNTMMVNYVLNDSSMYWLETAPRTGSFTNGGGAFHDEKTIYHYSIDTTSIEGRENLASLKFCAKTSADVNKLEPGLAVKLSSMEPTADFANKFNDYAAAGSFWGANPKQWGTAAEPLKDAQTTIHGTPEENFKRLTFLDRSYLANSGLKEFIIAVRMKGKFFNDTRTVLSRSWMWGQNPPEGWNYKQYFLDIYPAKANLISPTLPEYIGNGSTITNIFDFALDNEIGITDLGGSKVNRVELIIAKAPDTLIYDYWNWAGDKYSPVTLNDLYKMKHTVFPFSIRAQQSTIKEVRWDAIDPSSWASGRYLFGIVVYDEYGTGGLASMGWDGAKSINPLVVTIQTGK